MTFESPNSIKHEAHAHKYAEGSPDADLSRHVQESFHPKHHHHHSHHQHHHGGAGSDQDSGGGPGRDGAEGGAKKSGGARPGDATENGATESGAKKFGGALEQLAQNRSAQLLDKSVSPEDKLSALRELSKSGKDNFEMNGSNGEKYKMRIEREQSGSHEMVHLWVTGPDGKEKVALRGIADEKGQFTQEKDKSGKAVDWYGSGGAAIRNGADRNIDGDNVPPSDRKRLRDGQDQPPLQRAEDQPNWLPQPLLDAQGSQVGRQTLDQAAADARQHTHQLIDTSKGVYLRAGMAIDADGSPRARQIDPDGQANTSMRYADNKSLNAEVVPYMVLPGGKYAQHGISTGDMVLVRNTDNGKMAIAVFGDVGPRNKSGEGSMALASQIGLNPNPRNGGTSRPNIEYLVLPGTHGTKPQNQDELMNRIKIMREQYGIT